MIENARATTFFHSGDLGDIIYGLLFAREHRPIALILGPEPGVTTRQPMTPALFAWLQPLLARQTWIRSAEFGHNHTAACYNLNGFRKTWFDPRTGCARRRRLFETYAEHFNEPALPENEAWLEADPVADMARPVVVSRSPRYNNNAFPWAAIAKRYANRLRFVGLPEEFAAWTRAHGPIATHATTRDALELANVIAGAALFIGNQSFPMALALALNVPVLQEVCASTPDCVFHRPNAQFIASVADVPKLPAFPPPLMRHVSNTPDRHGIVELGPCAAAMGLGDTLTVTPVARELGNGAVMLLPRRLAHFAFLFHRLCPVRFDENPPVFPWDGHELVTVTKLAKFNLRGCDPVPTVRPRPALVACARELLATHPNPIAFTPTCSRVWAHVRQRPEQYWRPVIEELRRRFTVIQFGWDDYPLLPGCMRLPFPTLEQMAALFHVIGVYVGVHTGDHHLMLAVGGRAVVAEPSPSPEFHAALWHYNCGRDVYAELSDSRTVLSALQQLNL